MIFNKLQLFFLGKNLKGSNKGDNKRVFYVFFYLYRMGVYHSIHYVKNKDQYGPNEEVSVVVYYYYKGKKVKWSVGVGVKIKDWNGSDSTPVSRTDKDYRNKNLKVQDFKIRVNKEIQKIEINGLIPYSELVKKNLKVLEERKVVKTKREFDFSMLREEYLKSVEINTDMKETTKKVLRSNLNQISLFIKEELKENYFSLDRFDEEFLEKYRYHCVKQMNRSNSTIQKQLKVLKTFLNWCKRRGFTDISLPRLKITSVEKDIVYLQLEEIVQLNDFNEFNFQNKDHTKHSVEYYEDNLTNRKRIKKRTYTNLEVYKDMLVFGCGVGCRFGDLVKIRVGDLQLDGTQYIRFVMEKTKRQVRVPFNDFTEPISRKYSNGKSKEDYLFPMTPQGNFISNQKFNRYVKVVCEKVGLNRMVVKREYVGQETREGTDLLRPLHEVVSSHIVRRTFIREGINSNLPYHIIRSMSGHTSDKVFQSYFSTLDEERDDGMKKMFQFRVSNQKEKSVVPQVTSNLENELRKLKDLYDKNLIPEKVYQEKVSLLI